MTIIDINGNAHEMTSTSLVASHRYLCLTSHACGYYDTARLPARSIVLYCDEPGMVIEVRDEVIRQIHDGYSVISVIEIVKDMAE